MQEYKKTIGLYEKLPIQVIQDITIEPKYQQYAEDKSHPLYPFLNKDYLRFSASVFALGREYAFRSDGFPDIPHDTLLRLSEPSSLRGITIRNFQKPMVINSIGYTEIDAKSTGMTPAKIEERREFRSRKDAGEDTDGMFGSKSKLFDAKIEEEFLQFCGRSSSIIATIYLDNTEFGKWLQKKKYVTSPLYDTLDMLRLVDKHGDQTVIPARLTNPSYANARYNMSRGPYNVDKIIMQGARIFLAEIGNNEALFRNRYEISSSTIPYTIKKNLQKLTHGEINKETLNAFFQLESYLMGFNSGRFTKFSKNKYHGTLFVKNSEEFLNQSQDLCVGALWKDFEECLLETLSQQEWNRKRITEEEQFKKDAVNGYLEYGLNLISEPYESFFDEKKGFKAVYQKYNQYASYGYDAGFNKLLDS